VGDSPLADKIGHAAAYLVLGFLVYACLLPVPPLRGLLAAVTGCVLLGAVLELIQPWGQRNRELGDLLADAVGASAGALLALGLAGPLSRARQEGGR